MDEVSKFKDKEAYVEVESSKEPKTVSSSYYKVHSSQTSMLSPFDD